MHGFTEYSIDAEVVRWSVVEPGFVGVGDAVPGGDSGRISGWWPDDLPELVARILHCLTEALDSGVREGVVEIVDRRREVGSLSGGRNGGFGPSLDGRLFVSEVGVCVVDGL